MSHTLLGYRGLRALSLLVLATPSIAFPCLGRPQVLSILRSCEWVSSFFSSLPRWVVGRGHRQGADFSYRSVILA